MSSKKNSNKERAAQQSGQRKELSKKEKKWCIRKLKGGARRLSILRQNEAERSVKPAGKEDSRTHAQEWNEKPAGKEDSCMHTKEWNGRNLWSGGYAKQRRENLWSGGYAKWRGGNLWSGGCTKWRGGNLWSGGCMERWAKAHQNTWPQLSPRWKLVTDLMGDTIQSCTEV